MNNSAMREVVINMPLPESLVLDMEFPDGVDLIVKPMVTEDTMFPIAIGPLNEKDSMGVIGRFMYPLRRILSDNDKNKRLIILENECHDFVGELQTNIRELLTKWLDAPTQFSSLPVMLFNREDENKKIITVVFYRLIKADEKQAVPRIPQSPTPFNDEETALAPNNPFTHFMLSAVVDGGPLARFKPNGWHENTVNGEPQYVKRHVGGAGSTWRAAFDTQTRNAAELWAVVERLSALHGQLVMYLLAKMGDKRNGVCYPLLEAVTVSSDEFLRIKCFQKRGHSRQLVMRDLATCMKDISELTTDVRDIPMDGRKVNIPNCKLFHIAEVYEEQLTLDGKTEQIHVGWSIQAGPWATYYFKDGGRYWLSAMSRALLELDYREVRRAEVIAFKIGVLWLVVAGGTDYRNRTLTPTVADLLTGIGELPDPEHRGANWVNRTDEALRTALETLQGAGLLAAYSFGPTYPDPRDRGRGWAERWLSATVTMTTPEAAALEQQQVVATQKKLPAALEKKRRNRGTGKPKRTMTPGQYLDAATVAAVRKAYKERNWTQETLARELKIARPTLSNVLNKREPPSVELAARIRAWLDSPQPD